jgi:glycosyltransferase involved in cell wall biosynthesis
VKSPGNTETMKTVFVEPLWKLRREFDTLVNNPPEGYRFITLETMSEGLFKRLSKTEAAYRIYGVLEKWVPINLAKPAWESFRKLPPDVDLTYAVQHPVFRKEPWVLDMRSGADTPLLAGSEPIFERSKRFLRRVVASSFCRRIIFELEEGRRAFRQAMDFPGIDEKCNVIHSSVPQRRFRKSHNPDHVKLLFVNSANVNAKKHFEAHGGRVLLEAFLQLRRKYKNLELVVRSSVPWDIKAKFSNVPGLRIIESVIPWEKLEFEFLTSDIFVYPTHVTPSIVFLDAMSYELPIVTTDVWANHELVAEGCTGLLVHHPEARGYIEGSMIHYHSTRFKRATSSVDPVLTAGIVEKVGLLIENLELRTRMGRAGRQEVEDGKFSMKQRNEKLKRVLDESIEGFPKRGSFDGG